MLSMKRWGNLITDHGSWCGRMKAVIGLLHLLSLRHRIHVRTLLVSQIIMRTTATAFLRRGYGYCASVGWREGSLTGPLRPFQTKWRKQNFVGQKNQSRLEPCTNNNIGPKWVAKCNHALCDISESYRNKTVVGNCKLRKGSRVVKVGSLSTHASLWKACGLLKSSHAMSHIRSQRSFQDGAEKQRRLTSLTYHRTCAPGSHPSSLQRCWSSGQ